MSTDEECDTEFLAEVGCALLSCQATEKVLAFCLTHLFPDKPTLSVEMLERSDKKKLKRMLGQLIGRLRERIDFPEVFDTELSNFLEDRNTLVHHLTRVTKHGYTPEGQAEMKEFVRQTRAEADRVGLIFVGLIEAWRKHQGLPSHVDAESIRETLGLSFELASLWEVDVVDGSP